MFVPLSHALYASHSRKAGRETRGRRSVGKRPCDPELAEDMARVRQSPFFDGDDRARKLSPVWTLLLLLAAVIASASSPGLARQQALMVGAVVAGVATVLWQVLSYIARDGERRR
jgi:hypothetical protein